MDDTFHTIAKPIQGIFKDKGSKFLAFAYPVNSEEEIQRILDKVHRDYYDARHHCYAWRLGADHGRYRANDDGEPSGTAGLPILNQIKSKNLTNVLVVVVRYFGGILLGASGLTNAYKTSAITALNEAEVVKKTVNQLMDIHFDYPATNEVMRIIKDIKPEIITQQFDRECKITISIRLSMKDAIMERLRKIESVIINEKNG